MTHPQVHIRGIPYVPGSAQGTLQRGWSHAGPTSIVLLSQRDIGPFAKRPAGLLIEEGAPLSHAMIGVLSAGIPTVIISARQASVLQPGTPVRLDGSVGLLTTDTAVRAPGGVGHSAPAPAAGQAMSTADGVAVHLAASVRSVARVREARLAGAEAIGLVRSEFLLPPETAVVPDAAFYQGVFGELCEAAAPLAVTIRLLDLASDKLPPWVPSIDAASSSLGLQGVRLYGFEPVRQVFHAQLAAVDALTDRFDIRLLIPYLSRYEELRYWADYIRDRLPQGVAVGAMVETPASALDLNNWFGVADFVSVGCNDLMQCLFAADRDLPELRSYLDPYAPPLFRFLRQVADSAAGDLHRIQLCGVLSQLPGVLPILLGLGYRRFSVDAALIAHLLPTIRTITTTDARALADQVCAATESRKVAELLGLESAVSMPFLAP